MHATSLNADLVFAIMGCLLQIWLHSHIRYKQVHGKSLSEHREIMQVSRQHTCTWTLTSTAHLLGL